MRRAALEYLCPTFEYAAADSGAQSTAECRALNNIEIERGYKQKKTDHVPGFVVDLSKVLLNIKVAQEEKL